MIRDIDGRRRIRAGIRSAARPWRPDRRPPACRRPGDRLRQAVGGHPQSPAAAARRADGKVRRPRRSVVLQVVDQNGVDRLVLRHHADRRPALRRPRRGRLVTRRGTAGHARTSWHRTGNCGRRRHGVAARNDYQLLSGETTESARSDQALTGGVDFDPSSQILLRTVDFALLFVHDDIGGVDVLSCRQDGHVTQRFCRMDGQVGGHPARAFDVADGGEGLLVQEVDRRRLCGYGHVVFRAFRDSLIAGPEFVASQDRGPVRGEHGQAIAVQEKHGLVAQAGHEGEVAVRHLQSMVVDLGQLPFPRRSRWDKGR